MQTHEKVFNTGNKILTFVEYNNENPDIIIESQDDGNLVAFEIDSIKQLDLIILHLQAIRKDWE